MKSAYSHFASACGYRVIWVQLLLIGVVALFGAWLWGLSGFVSALLGGGVWFVPTFFFLMIFLMRRADRSPVQILIDFYIGELVKFFLSIVLMVLVFWFYPINVWPFILSYLLAVFSVWVVMYLELRAERK